MFKEVFPCVFSFQPIDFGSNVFLLAGKKTALIDSSTESNKEPLLFSLEKIGFSPKQIDFVLHTHGHADHFGNSSLFKNSELLMHKFDAEFVNKKDFDFTAASIIETKHFPKISSFFKENQIINLGNFKLKVLFTAGHTKGSVCFFEEKQGLLFSGDTLFNAGVGRTDLPSGSAEELLSSIKKISKLSFKTLLPGHGSILKGEQKSNIDSALEGLSKAF